MCVCVFFWRVVHVVCVFVMVCGVVHVFFGVVCVGEVCVGGCVWLVHFTWYVYCVCVVCMGW